MARKDRSDSVLDGLPTERKEKLIAWLVDENIAYTEAVQRVWEKFGVKTSTQALQRFYAKKCFRLVASQANEFADMVVERAAQDPEKFDQATMVLIRQKAFERAYARNGNLDELAMLAGIIGDSSKIELKRRELELQRDRFLQTIKSDIEKGLDALHAEIRGNAEALALFEKLKAAVLRSVEGKAA